ncbi:hypothetical protein M405DRAFT_833093 [Rhizopogon salebrosus TDB-379]|nr:hypothetical protein M405DRAFT_833093 [Rhizopogon salebrosus TDB-379]
MYFVESPRHNMWKLQYLEYEDDTERVCLLSGADSKCCNYLGVGAVNNNIPIYRQRKPQLWSRRKEDGISIYQVSSGVIYAWYLAQEGEPIIISDIATPQWQSWEFVAPA